MMRKRIKQGSALVLTLALMFSVLSSTEIFAARTVEQTADHSMTINLQEYTPDELNTLDVTADIYKIAAFGVTGKYTAEEAFADLADAFTSLKPTDNAAQWTAISEAAVAVVEAGEATPLLDDEEFEDKVLTVDGLMPGLYLIIVPQVTSDLNKYNFTPALVSLPGIDADKEWVKSVEATLKSEQLPREGFLIVEKDILNYNTTNDSAVFAFEIEAVYDEEVIYNDVVAIDFAELASAPDSDWVKIGPVRAGAAATVTEVYTGAGYKNTGAGSQTVTIIADPALDDIDEEERDAVIEERLAVKDAEADVTVTFENTHNDVPNGGTGIVNRFEATDNGWQLDRDDQGQDTRPQA